MKLSLFLSVICTAAALNIQAAVVPNSLFSDHAILQRNVPVPVWGTAREGETVTVTFAGQNATTTAVDGKWMLKLKPLKAGGPFTMVIKGDNTISITDILVGEVWVCSGQSNMSMPLGPRNGQRPIIGWEKERDDANYPQIRQYKVNYNPSPVAVPDAKSSWVICSPQTVPDFSAVGYFFVSDLYRKLKVPVGLLFSAVGGTAAESWTSFETLDNTPQQKRWALSYLQSLKQYPENLEKYKKEEPALLEKYQADVELAKKENKPMPRRPAPPGDPAKSGAAGGLYNGMIRPLQPYAIKGVIWYQGESNNPNAGIYQNLFTAMITDWRKAWGQGDYPFLFVQIAPFKGISPELREAQFLTAQNVPNTAMAVITDYGEAEDIHPIEKKPVGERLSLAARALAYQENTEYSGPQFKSMTVEGASVTLNFTHAQKLVAKDGPLKGFVIAGADRVFVPATAEIKGKTIVVSNPAVKQPVAVRYGWANVPDVNLYNEKDLPASPFRTDVGQ